MSAIYQSLTFSVARELKLRDEYFNARAQCWMGGYSGENVLCRARTENTIQSGLAVEGGVAP